MILERDQSGYVSDAPSMLDGLLMIE